MIDFQCASCGKTYRVSDDKAGVKARCKECQAVMTVPAPGGEIELDIAPGASAPASTAPPALPLRPVSSRGFAEASTSQRNRIAQTKGYPFGPDQELSKRKNYAILLGVLLLIGALMPEMDPMGRSVSFVPAVALTEPGIPISMRILLVYPLFAGIVTLAVTAAGSLAARSWTLAALGVGYLALSALSVSESGMLGMIPTGTLQLGALMVLLFFASVWGTVIGARARWLRPETPAAYPIGAAGAVAMLLMLVIPIEGQPLITVPFVAMKQQFAGGLGLLIAMGLWVTAGIICLANVPSRRAPAASSLAKVALNSMRGVVIIMIVVGAMTFLIGGLMSGLGQVVIIGLLMVTRAACLFLGIMLLLPVGVVDLLIGVPRVDPYECMQCGYNLRGTPSGQCPECGQLNLLPTA